MTIKIKKLNTTATIPTRGSEHAAGYDLYANNNEQIAIAPHETVKVPTGIAIEVPAGYAGFIYARSGLATKQGLRPANAVGVCDSDYVGEYIVALHNDSGSYQRINKGDRIAQLVIAPYLSVDFEEVDELDNTERGSNGFGSTGVQ